MSPFLHVSLSYVDKYASSLLFTDPLFILTPPKQSVVILPLFLWKTLTATLATRFDKPAAVIRKLIPKTTYFVQYGRAQQLEGGDTIHAHEVIPLKSDSRDMSFVRV
jgi:hypothetical protein